MKCINAFISLARIKASIVQNTFSDLYIRIKCYSDVIFYRKRTSFNNTTRAKLFVVAVVVNNKLHDSTAN